MTETIRLSSTALASATYDEDTRRLDITFTSGGTFTYENVPPDVFEGLREARSPGTFYHERIKGQF